MKCLNSTLLAAAAAASLLFVVPAHAHTLGDAGTAQSPAHGNSWAFDAVICGDQDIPASLSGVPGCDNRFVDTINMVTGHDHSYSNVTSTLKAMDRGLNTPPSSWVDLLNPGFLVGHEVQPTTTPSVRYSWTHHSVQITGVLNADGKPVAYGKVNVLVVLEGDFSHWQPVWADGNGVYATTIHAPSRIASVSVNAPSACSTGDDDDCERQAYVTGAASIGVGELP